MAIAKMAKLRAIVEESNRDLLMRELQAVQRVEVKPVDKEALSVIHQAPDQQEASDLENALDDVRAAMKYLESYLPSRSFKEQYITPLPVMTIDELESQLDLTHVKKVTDKVWQEKRKLETIDSDLQSLDSETDFLRNWQNLETIPNYHQPGKHTKLYLGMVPQTNDNEYIQAIRQHPKLIVEEIYQNKEEIGLVVAVNLDDAREANEFLTKNRFQNLDYRFKELPATTLKADYQRAEDLRKEALDVRKHLGTFTEEYDQLKVAEEMLYARVERKKAQDHSINTDRLFAVEGWVVAEEADAIIDRIEQKLHDAVYLELAEVEAHEMDDVPTELKNNRLVEPFETVTGMYGVPKYQGFDPSGSLAPYYWIFFGMMIADLGYGLLLWLGTLIPLKFFNIGKDMKKNLRFFHYLSYSAILWGLIYGSVFGESLPFRLLSPTENVIEVLALSIGLGFIQILHGLAINTHLNWKEDKLAAIKDGLSWIIMLVGFVIAIVGPMLLKMPILQKVGLYLAAIAALMILVIAIMKSKNKAAGVAAGLYDLYGVSGYLGDIVSYSRLMALGISGGSIALAFNILVAYLPPVARFSVGIVLIVFLQLFNFGLSLLSAYVHSARLIFVEFFGKFYEGGGRSFAPLKFLDKHLNIK